jgi:type II secretory pathway component PulL
VLRTAVEEIIERDDITRWLSLAETCGIDPL